MKLISERSTINWLSSSTSSCGITALDHKAWNHSMKYCVVIIIIHAELQKVTSSERSLSSPNLNFNLSMGGEEDDFCVCGRFIFVRVWLHYYKSIKVPFSKGFIYRMIQKWILWWELRIIFWELEILNNKYMNQEQFNKIDNYFLKASQNRDGLG